jgi:type IV pilus assembly protein PilV
VKKAMTKYRKPRQAGFSLVEVLIALVIMSVGMLGIAGLYVQSLQAGRTSMFRHHAVTLASDVADRIRANPLAGIAYIDPVGADNNCVGGALCTAAQMAANDVFLWKEQAQDTLPGGDVTVVFAPAAGLVPPSYQITISWTEPNQIVAPTYVITIPVRAV